MIERVRDGGEWGCKRKPAYPKGQAYGEFQYGALAYSMGFDWATTWSGAQAYSLKSGVGLEEMMPAIKAGYLHAARGC